MTKNNNRVCCLYRVSTDKQVDFNSNHEADLPMQRKACHKFAESKGWVIVHEEQEEGVSGHKVRAAARDKLQIIKDYAERKNHLQDLQTQRNKAEKDLLALKTEVLACIKGESVLPRETLAEMITAQEEKLTELENLCEAASEELEKTAELMDKVSRLYDELISYADLYDSANFEAKKMIVNQLIRRVDVYRGYQINISFNFDLTPYIEGE